jgi:SAM-dependent methyltransferase
LSAPYLAAQLSSPFTYRGVDFSTPLLDLARARQLGVQCQFVEADILDEAWNPATGFDLIVVLGVLHHVPSIALRKRLLAKLATALAPGGTLALTFWRLDEDPRFASRIVPCTLVPSEDLEPGDTFLRWGAADAPPRYCHFADAAEVLALCDTTGLSRVAHFRSDGRGDALNEYVVLRSNA